MRAFAVIAVAFALTPVIPFACGSSDPGFGGSGGSANGGAGGAANGGSTSEGGKAQGGQSHAGGSGGTSANGGGGGTHAGGSSGNGGGGFGGGCEGSSTDCSDPTTGCAHCALAGDCMDAIDACVADTDCRQYAICCNGMFPCAAHCKTDEPAGATKFKPVDACVCKACEHRCASSCG